MKDIILLIDDNDDLLFNLKLLFEMNNFDTVTASNGKQAYEKINNEHFLPTIIVCDIMMPVMDGYEFFKLVSNNPNLNSIPFIFLTAKSSSDDIRFGKLLGIDDYLTKSFEEEDLLSIVIGKIAKRRKIIEVNSQFDPFQTNLPDNLHMISEIHSFSDCILFIVQWDEMEGPVLLNSYSKSPPISDSDLKRIGVQLYQSSVSIFGFQDDVGSESLLLSIKNIEKKGFLFFDSYEDSDVRGGKRLFMFGLINKEISYFDSLIIEKVFRNLSKKFKNNRSIDLEKSYNLLIKKGKLIVDEI